MPGNTQNAPAVPSPPILAEAEVTRRMLRLAQLHAALAMHGVRSVLARNHRLALRYNSDPCEPSGLTDPTLHIFGPSGTDIATTDGIAYSLASGGRFPADDPIAAAAVVLHGRPAAPAWPADRVRVAAGPGLVADDLGLAHDTVAVADPALPADGLGRAVLGLLPSERGHPVRIASTAAEAAAIVVRVLRPTETRRDDDCQREPR